MKRLTNLLCLCVFFSSVVETSADENGYFMYSDFWCALYPGEEQLVEYLIDWYFNKEFTMQYNSTVGKWTGFTPGGLITASSWNEDQHDVLQRKLEKQLICVNNVGLALNATKENMAEPSISLQAVESTSSTHDTLLVCSAYDFYPKKIRITWHHNGQEVTSGVTLSEATNEDWTYQVHSYLEYTSGRHDTVTCMVEHATLKEPRVYEWDSSLNKSDRSFLIGGVFALVFGTLFLSLGLFHYRKKSCDPRFSNAL
ncbi:SLA class II histocompatibility antigen, DQ haplotype C beta chain-like [Anabas testudineus]|uniref:Ig-like domain-containing protein n=1 Tax=Anabas testudineus TaxID=64144 RepID=A0A3Q1HI33_ANATE|nr:SLA class II histocompatibility antigen, DQ haplotype C beta chain-like [Anabas testudineus]